MNRGENHGNKHPECWWNSKEGKDVTARSEKTYWHVFCSVCENLVTKTEGNKALGRTNFVWEDNIKIDFN